MEEKRICVKARLVAQMEDGAYTKYVFQDLEAGGFVMAVRVPNWKGTPPEKLQDGFLEYKFVQAGMDTYFDNSLGRFRAYQYTNNYFLDFVPITHVLQDGYVTQIDAIQIKL